MTTMSNTVSDIIKLVKKQNFSEKELDNLIKEISGVLINKKKQRQKVAYLNTWVEAFRDAFDYNQSIKTNKTEALFKFVVDNFSPEDFSFVTGEFIGKNSTRFGCSTTAYLMDNYNLYYTTSEWGNSIRWTGGNHYGEVETMSEIVKPLSLAKILLALSKLNNKIEKEVSNFKEELLKYMHCEYFDGDAREYGEIEEQDFAFIEKDHYFGELAY